MVGWLSGVELWQVVELASVFNRSRGAFVRLGVAFRASITSPSTSILETQSWLLLYKILFLIVSSLLVISSPNGVETWISTTWLCIEASA